MARPKKGTSLMDAVSSEIKSKFDINAFKESKGLGGTVNFKEQKWIPFSPALREALSIPGLPMGHLSIVRGRSDTGKTTLMIETAISAQQMEILPVFIITEMKWDFLHAKEMGLEINIDRDPQNPDNINYSGFFLYADRSTLHTIEDVASFIIDILDEQKKGNLPYDLLFLWDSVGSIPCKMSVEAKNNNPQWNAGAMATQFGNFVNQKFTMSRKSDFPYTNTLLVVNKVGVQPAQTVMSQPRMTNKGGDAMYWDASLVITFGNITNSGTSKLRAQKNNKAVEYAKKTKIAIDKIHTGIGVTTSNTIVVTPHGFIPNKESEINQYKKHHSKTWFDDDTGEIILYEDKKEWEEDFMVNEEQMTED